MSLAVGGPGMAGAGIAAGLRRRLLQDPKDPAALADALRGTAGPAAVFRWYRRLVAVDLNPDGDVVRRALEAAGAIDQAELARFANGGSWSDLAVVPFAGAALLLHGRVPAGAAGTDRRPLASFGDILSSTAALLGNRATPSSLRETFQILITKQHVAALLRRAGHLGPATAVARDASVFSRAMRRQIYGGGVRGFTEHWTFAIGHMVLLAFLIRGQQAGIMDFSGVQVWKGPVANWYLWERTRRLSARLQVVPRGAGFADSHSSSALEWIDGRFVDLFEACGIIADRAGDAAGAILQRPTAAQPALARFYAACGFAPEDRLVTLHCREPGYRVNDRHDLRNADIAGYLPALRALSARGWRVVRLGDPSMTPLPAIDGVVDYARSPLKSAELDVLLPAVARFHIGSSSGLSLVPLLFGTPCLFLNWYPFDLLPWGRRNWTVLKPIEALSDGRRVADPRRYAELGQLREAGVLRGFGHRVRDLRPEEVERTILAFAEAVPDGPPAPATAGRNLGRVLLPLDGGRLAEIR